MMSVKQTAENLPANLNVLYEQTLNRIKQMHPERARIGLMALMWVTHAKRRLHIQELQEALATHYTVGSFRVGHFNPDAVPAKDLILASSCGLLTVNASGEVYLTRELPLSLRLASC